jgi:hypothetical protein
MVFYALVLLVTLIAYGIARYQSGGKPVKHKPFILAALAAGALIAVCDVQSDSEEPVALTLYRAAHLIVFVGIVAGSLAAYKVIQMAPPQRRVPLAWVICLYLLFFVAKTGYQFKAEVDAVHCGAGAQQGKGDVVAASNMYKRICNKGDTDLRGDVARMLHHPEQKDDKH